MKRLLILQWIAAALTAAALAAAVMHVRTHGIFLVAVLIIAASVQAALLALTYQQSRIMAFLKSHSQSAGGQFDEQMVLHRQQQEELLRRQVELSSLQSQINPHFLYNTLDSIRSKALIEGQHEIADMTEILSNFFRYCIGNVEQLVKVREELGHVNDYYVIQKFRFEDRFDLTISLEDDAIKDLYLPKMSIQPLIENAMMHGLERVNRKGLIEVSLMLADQGLVITVSDNGAGMSQEQLSEMNRRLEQDLPAGSTGGRHSGIGVANVNARIKLMFGPEYGIRYRSVLGSGTDAVIRMPQVNDFSRIRFEER